MTASGHRRYDVLSVKWFSEAKVYDLASIERLLEVIRDTVPEAMPTHYRSDSASVGFDWSERFLWRDAVAKGASWRSNWPFFGGSLSNFPSPGVKRFSRFVSTKLYIDMVAMLDVTFERRCLDLVSAIGQATESFYAFAVVESSLKVRDGELIGDHESRVPRPRVTDGSQWLGLPWSDVEFEWFGQAYLPLLGAAVFNRGEFRDGGLLLKCRDTADRVSLLPLPLLARFPDGGPAEFVPPQLRHA
jgi:hypothetical protein